MLPNSLAAVNSILALTSKPYLRVADICRATKLEKKTVEGALRTLMGRGVVSSIDQGNFTAYHINQNSPYFEAAYRTALVDLPLEKFIDQTLLGKFNSVYVYGSIVDPDSARQASDIDLMFLGRGDAFELYQLLKPLGEVLGRKLDVGIKTLEEIDQMYFATDSDFGRNLLNYGISIRGHKYEPVEV